LIRKLNNLGVESIIATSSSVDAGMAGKFCQCMDEQLMKNRTNQEYTISDMYSDCILNCLWEKEYVYEDTKKQYGANALKYILLGNGNLRLVYPYSKEEK
jgi:hypothetical protein